jgi:rfaE bifunctional protein nucleotidyltransferase chain/domain
MVKTVFTNGIFDIIHPGHIELLKFCKELAGVEGKVIVAINSDRSTKEFKGPHRPLNNQADRKKVLEGIRYVDEVVIFDDKETLSTILHLQPNILVKGGEFTPEQIRIRDEIPNHIDIKTFQMIQGYSTTEKIKQIKLTEDLEKKPDTKPFA